MIRKLSIAAALVGSITLGGCTTTQFQDFQTITAEFIRQARAVAIEICGFAPDPSFIEAVFGRGQYTTYYAIGKAACDHISASIVVTPQGRRSLGRVAYVSGIPVRGRFVR